jgi:hypothetical protein
MRVLKLLVLASIILPLFLAAEDASLSVRLADRSDWWSVLNENFYWHIEKPKSEELSEDNFDLAGIKFENDPSFRGIRSKFGRAISASRGNASSGRQQICYSSSQNPPAHLIFEQGESNLSFYLVAGGQSWNGEALCLESSQLSASLRTKSGLGLGMSPAEVEQILGKADLSDPARLIYQREVERRTPDAKLVELRNEHSDSSEKDFHENYDTYDLELYIEARFTDGKLTFLAVSKAESY